VSDQQVTVIGAGLVGSLLACYLGRRGYQVDVYERRSDPRKGTSEQGRSINLALSERGLDALRRIDLVDQVMAPALPMHGRMMHDLDGTLTYQSYAADGSKAINSIGRGSLNHTLLDAAETTPGVRLHFDKELTNIDVTKKSLTFAGRKTPIRYQVLLGADGGGSVVRNHLAAQGLVAVTEDILDYGYKELVIPAQNNEFALDPDALHIWPRGNSMMIALPNPDKSFTCTLFWPKTDFAALDSPRAVIDYFTQTYPDAVRVMPTYVDDYLNNPVGMLGTIHTHPWILDGSVALIGDAAHAIVPFFGQGANCGFEDVVELDRCLNETNDDWPATLARYQADRIPNAEAIAQMALENFVEMRDHVGSKRFLLQRKFEHTLEQFSGGRYQTRYHMVSFSTIPYAEVLERDAKQRKAVGLAAGTAAVGAAVGAFAAARKVFK